MTSRITTFSLMLTAALSAAELKYTVSTSTGLVDTQHVATDAAGNTYVAGTSSSTTATFLHGLRGGASDVRVMKLDPNGQTVWSAMIGAPGTDIARGIALDSAGNVYVAAESTNTLGWPAAATPLITGTAGIVASLSNNGSTVRYSSFFAGPPIGISADPDGNAYSVSVFPNQLTARLVKFNTVGTPLFDVTVNPFSTPATAFTAGPSGFLVYYAPVGGILRTDGLGASVSQTLTGLGSAQGKVALDPSGNGDFYLALAPPAGTTAGTLRLQKRNQNLAILRDTTFGAGVTSLGGVSLNDRGEIWILGQTSSLSYPEVFPFATSNGRNLQTFVTVFNSTFGVILSSYVPVSKPTAVAADPFGASFAINGSQAGRILMDIADLGISVLCGPRTGSSSSCTGTVQNLGPNTGRNIRTVTVFPLNINGVSMTATQGSCTYLVAQRMAICTIGDMPSGSSVQVSITANILANTNTTWRVSPSGSTDPNSANNFVTAQYN